MAFFFPAACCEGAVSRYAAVMPTTVQSDSGKRERSSATSNFVLMAAIMVPARADGDAEVVRELHPVLVLVLVVYGRARQQDLEADLREEGQPNRQQVLEPVHKQPHGVDGEDLLPRKRAQPQLAGPSGPARAQLCHSGLFSRSARLLQRHRPDGAEAQAAPDEIRQLGGHGANWFELNKLLSIEK